MMLELASVAFGEDQKVFVFWDTVSPDGKYALAWTENGSIAPEDMPNPDEDDRGVQNWLMELQSRKLTLLVPHSAFWILPDGTKPQHYSLETVWSDDSASLIALVNFRWPTGWSTGPAFIVKTKPPQVSDLLDPMQKTFERVLTRTAGDTYRKRNSDLYFFNPWFVRQDRFEIVAEAGSGPIKADEEGVTYNLTFSFHAGSNAVTMERASVVADAEESSDRQLNRAYRSLIGMLQPAERETLRREERGWIDQRDAAKGAEAKKKLVQARVEELEKRKDDRVNQLDAAQKQ